MARTVYLETFGCQMNELDSELVAGRLRALGYTFTPDSSRADVLLYNTCSVREHAEQKVWSRLGDLVARKQDQPALVVGVLGCLAERDGVSLVKRMPVVDILCGPGELDKLPTLLDNAVRTRASLLGDLDPAAPKNPAFTPDRVSANQVALQGSASRRSSTLAAAEDSLELLDLSRSISPLDEEQAPRSSAYVRITRGCNKFCTYCVVPFTRGAEMHRPPDHIVEECRKLADAGVIEITLLGQTVNHYRFEHGAAVSLNGHVQPQKGRAFSGGHRRDPLAGAHVTTFADLLRRIHDEVPAIKRLRFVTSYPRDFGDDVLEVIRDHPRICRYLHVPGQSGSDRILKLMNRGYTRAEYVEFLERARQTLDQPHLGRPLSISGDIIVGFPTETEDDFAQTVSLLKLARYKNCFIFKYSPRPGTTAYDKLEDDVPEEVKRRRNNELLALQATISEEVGARSIGQEFDVLVEGLSRKEQKKRPARAHRHQHAGAVALTISGKPAAEQAGEACCEDGACTTPETANRPAPITPGEERETVQLSCRTDGDLIVFVDCPGGGAAESLKGSIIRVRVTAARNLALFAEAVG